MSYSLGSVTIDQVGFIQAVPASVLVEVSAGRVDLNRLAREELANRGYDQHGVWIGFELAAAILDKPSAQIAVASGETRAASPERSDLL